MSFPVLGEIPLALVRTYDSFNERCSGLGLGWDITPAKLRFSKEKRWFHFSDATVLKCYPEIFVIVEGVEFLYSIQGLDAEKRPIYRSEGNLPFLLEKGDGGFAFYGEREQLFFDDKGNVMKISDRNGISIDYGYENGKITSISHVGGKTIRLEYEGIAIVRAVGGGGKIIHYSYTPEGQLQSVQDGEGLLMSYAYDKDLRLTAIFDAKGHPVFEANYAIYNRAEGKVIHGTRFRQEFSLSERKIRIEGFNNSFVEEQFDERYLPQRIVDSLGKTLEFSYTGPFGPEKTVDNNGLEVCYEYNSFGHPIKVTDAYRDSRSAVFDAQGNLSAETDGRETKTLYCYDEARRLVKMFSPFILRSVHIKNGLTVVEGDEDFATSFHYDSATGRLLAVDLPGGEKKSFRLDENGLPIEVCYSNGLISKRSYDDRSRLVKISEAGREITYMYNERDQVIRVSGPAGYIQHKYDEVGNLILTTDSNGNETHLEYDENYRLIRVIDAEGGVTHYRYNDFHCLTKMILPNGSLREIIYDPSNRPMQQVVGL